jgi:membrane-bound ClpP family serine protease
MDWWLAFAVFLYFACAMLLVAEVFIPSAGLLIMLSLACLAGGLFIFFKHSPAAGWLGVAIAIVMIPGVLVGAYKIFPHTKFGNRMLLAPPQKQAGEGIPDTDELKGLLGAVGTVITTMRPVGMCDIGGKRLECMAEGGFVEKDKKVKVIKVESTQVTVRVIQADSTPAKDVPGQANSL